jgi:hypothetical protein
MHFAMEAAFLFSRYYSKRSRRCQTQGGEKDALGQDKNNKNNTLKKQKIRSIVIPETS